MIVNAKPSNPGNQEVISRERLEKIGFKVHKFSSRERPGKDKTLIFCCFSEFGCEIVGVMYVIPRIMQELPGNYKIVVGWSGRSYLYKHLVDEFWEINSEHQWLREYCRAFHHDSINLKRTEKELKEFGHVISSNGMGNWAVGARCAKCNSFWGTLANDPKCPKCKIKEQVIPAILGNVTYWKPKAVKLPKPSDKSINYENSVGIFARGRKCYGRNLQPKFYIKLIKLLRNLGFEPIWLGEKETTLPCPVDDVFDFSRTEQARDLEVTLSIVSKLQFTIQFWTASTRLASLVRTPYLLFESPDQIYGGGQEGIRRKLCDFGKSKLVPCHFLNVLNNHEKALELVEKAIKEMQANNYLDLSGLLETDHVLGTLKSGFTKKHGV